MRILIISDTHGSRDNFDRILEKEGKFDLMLHLGDTEFDEDYLEAAVDCPCYFVCGNNDWGTGQPYDRIVTIGRHRLFLTHGHGYGLYFGYGDMIKAARAAGADTILHGHTHRPVDKEEEGIRILNPGSVTYPRQNGMEPSYIVAEVDEHDDLLYEQRYLPRRKKRSFL